MTQPSARVQDRRAMRDIKVGVRYAPEKFAPVDDLPTGTVLEVLQWVNYSPTRAKRLLAHEIAQPAPRISLIRTLYQFLLRERERARQANTPDAPATMNEQTGGGA